MLYVHTISENGVLTYTPITDENVYVRYRHCQCWVPLDDPIQFLSQYEGGTYISSIDLCDECMDEICEQEDEYCKKHYPK